MSKKFIAFKKFFSWCSQRKLYAGNINAYFNPFNGNTIVSFSPFSYARDAGRVDVADLLEEFIESQAMIAEGFEPAGEEYGDEDSFDEGGGVGQQQHLADVHHLQHHLAHGGGEEEEEEEGRGSQGLQQVSRGCFFLSADGLVWRFVR